MNIRSLRLERGLSQIELAEKVGISQAMLCYIERGTRVVSLPLAAQLASILGCKLEDLLEK